MKLESIKPFEPMERSTFSKVRRVGDFLVKTPLHYLSFAHLKRDYEVNVDLYKHDISVPRPIAFYPEGGRIRVGKELLTFDEPAFVREFIEGLRVSDVKGKKNERLMDMMNIEFDKARSLGYESSYDSEIGNNAIVTPDLSKVFLIDFGNWKLIE